LFIVSVARYAQGVSKRKSIVGLVTKVIRYLWLLLWWLLLPQAIASVESDNLEGIRSETVGGDIQPERPKSFQRVTRLDSSIRSDMRYASDQNFVGRPIAGYLAPVCYLANPAALALVEVHQGLLAQGYGLIVFDCYRPERATNDFVQWALTREAAQKTHYFPRTDKSELFAKGYIARHSGHSRGATVDVGLYRLQFDPAAASGKASNGVCRRRFAEDRAAGLLDFGSDYDCFDRLSQTAHPDLSEVAKQNRQRLVNAMAAKGFVNYDQEWWHFTFQPEPYPTVYFDFPITED
jgi:D-alanyl-D-alanine dipeptidase